MLAQIPTHLIAGPLGAGKTSLIRTLLAQRPVGQRWAVLLNEFGRIGIDAALLESREDGVQLAEVAGGCLCCVNGLPFQVGLARLLRQARPQRLLIEPSGLGHPLQLLRQLHDAPWRGVLDVQPPVLVLDAAAMAAGQALPQATRAILERAGLLLLNKSAGLSQAQRQAIATTLPDRPCHWSEHGRLPLDMLPGLNAPARAGNAPAHVATLGVDTDAWPAGGRPVSSIDARDQAWSIGWRWPPEQRFERQALAAWLAGLPWRRAKLIIHAGDGWYSANLLERAPVEWRTSEWRKDSRLELIFVQPQDATALGHGLAACRA